MQKISEIFEEAKESTARHQKLLKKLENIRNSFNEKLFFEGFLTCIKVIFNADLKVKKAEVNRVMLFAVKFCVNGNKRETQNCVDNSDVEMDEFLKQVINETLKFHDNVSMVERYRCCQFITMILKEMGDECIDDETWDAIQAAMLERLQDPKALVRLQAVTALLRLQVPTDSECPVIKAFINRLYDTSAVVRKAVVENIGPNVATIGRIIERLLDVDEHVRATAFRKCSLINPEYIKISNRQRVLQCGFSEKNTIPKRAFIEHLIPRWLGTFNDDMIQFFKKLNLDADEEDLEQTFKIYSNLMNVFCKNRTFEEVTSKLPLNDEKFVAISQLSFEVVSYWNLLSKHLRKMEDSDEYLEKVMPDLVDMCAYIEKFTKEKTSNKMEDYELVVYEYTLYLLFDMVEEYDFGDEVCRQTLHKLISDILLKYTFHSRLLDKLMNILVKLHNRNAYELTKEICVLVSEIREPLISVEPSENEKREYNVKIAELKFRTNILSEERDEAVKNADYIKAHNFKQELELIQQQLETLQSKPPEKKEKKIQDDVETTIRCLDILIALLKQSAVDSMTPFLQTCKDMYLEPLISNPNTEVFWRVMKLLVLYCIIDKDTMTENCKRIFGAVAFYKMTPFYQKDALFITIDAVSDLIRIYGQEILQGSDRNSTKSDESALLTSKRRNGVRRLYNADRNDDFDPENIGEVTFKDVIDILVDLLDDECPEVKLRAGTALVALLLDGLCSSASLVSRLIIKWHTLEYGTKLQQLLGVALVKYAQEVDGSEDILEKAVIPTLVSVAKAPKNSPLTDIDVDDLMRFLKAVTSIKVKQKALVCAHSNIAESILYKLNSQPHDPSVTILTKMLTQLPVTLFTETCCKEFIHQTEIAIEVIRDRAAQKNLEKFSKQLKQHYEKYTALPMETIEEGTEGTQTETIINRTESLKLEEKAETPKNIQLRNNSIKSSVKRKKRKSKKSIETKEIDTSNDTILHTIIDKSIERELIDDMTIETVSSNNSNSNQSLRRSMRNKSVVYTSTDSESSQKDTTRRTKKKKK